MDSCKSISRLVSAGLDRKLTAGERVRIRIHLLFCKHCRIVERQYLALRRFVRHLAEALEKDR
ncbi:MAG: zf-HC2 domain-containing protein [Betaproteobacteria bacterium]|nr:MAG: zf-HC2 domain-containing protein [Betaproteobacteria bacterium]